MKKILVIRGISAYDVLGRAADEICEGFRKCGYQVDMIGATDPGADDRFIECLEHRDQYAFYFSIQAILWNLESENLPELAEMKRVGWIVDDPVYHQKRIWGSLGTNARLLMVRDSHAAQLREEFSKFERRLAERTVERAPHRMARPLNQSLPLYEHLADSLSLHCNTASKKATYEVYIFVHGFSYSIPIHGNARKTRKLHAVFCVLSPALLRVTGA